MSSIVNKIKEAVNPDKTTGTYPHGTTSTAAAAEPRSGAGVGDNTATLGGGNQGYMTSDNYAYGGNAGPGPAPNTAGPHSSDWKNRVDPTVHNRSGPGPAPNTAGPHASDWQNKLDPRVDSDMDGSRRVGTYDNNNYATGNTTSTTGAMGTGGGVSAGGAFSSAGGPGPAPNTAGPHNRDWKNKVDPTVDSRSGPGPAPNTAGPHASDWQNKLDPRVDSDMDGSSTLGGNSNRTAYQS